MAQYQLTQDQVDVTLETRRNGSEFMILGWIIMGMAGLVGMYVLSAIRDGDRFWPTYVGTLFVVGLVLILGGAWFRSRERR